MLSAKFLKEYVQKKLIDARNNLTDMYLIQSLNNEFSFYFAFVFKVSGYFYKQLLPQNDLPCFVICTKILDNISLYSMIFIRQKIIYSMR